MVENGVYALVSYILGFVVLVRTDWAVQQALRMQKKYPNAFSSRLAERSWYPRFLRILGVVLLLLATIFTLEVAFQILAHFERTTASSSS